MSPKTAVDPLTQTPGSMLWEPPLPPTDLVFDDGEPLESNRHRIAMNVLIDSILTALQGQSNFFTGGNMFVYYSRNQKMNKDFRGPDFFVALDVEGDRERQGWVVWEEDGRYPDVIVELMSPSTAKVDQEVKKDLYERTFHTADYYVYDPFDPESLQGWHLDGSQRYQPLQPNDRGWLWCEALGLWLGTWQGSLRREPPKGTCHWLQFYDPNGKLVLLREEIAEVAQKAADSAQKAVDAAEKRVEVVQQQAEAAQQKAVRLAARLRELGEDPDVV